MAASQSETQETSGFDVAAMPQFQITDLTGRQLQPKDLEGRVVLVEFWATWCPPCRGTLAWLGKLKEQYGDRIAILTIAIESDEGDVRNLTKSLNLPVYWAMGTPEIAREFGDIAAVPTLYMFGRDGKTVDIYYGAPDDLHSKAEAAISATLQ